MSGTALMPFIVSHQAENGPTKIRFTGVHLAEIQELLILTNSDKKLVQN